MDEKLIKSLLQELTEEEAAKLANDILNETCERVAVEIRTNIERQLRSLSRRFPNEHFAFNGKSILHQPIPF